MQVFFKELAMELDLSQTELLELKHYIQAKMFLKSNTISTLQVNDQLAKLVSALPFLYGKPEDVLQQAFQLPLTEAMKDILSNISDICDNLAAYDLHDAIAIDLSLINHMDYYSDLIFQGFIEQVGKPILMGGRYNSLANQFGADIPAVGFACDLDLLIAQTDTHAKDEETPLDAIVIYEKKHMRSALFLASRLRSTGLQIVTYPADADANTFPNADFTIVAADGAYQLTGIHNSAVCHSEQELIAFLQKERN